MKKLLIIIIVAIAALNANAQKLKETDVPIAVKAKFTSLYHNITNVKWEKEDIKYEAEFEQNKVETSVLFDAGGALVQTETEIPVTSLPHSVSDYVFKNLTDKKIAEAIKIIDANGNVSYETEVGKADYLFDANGNFIKKEVDKNDTENDDKEIND